MRVLKFYVWAILYCAVWGASAYATPAQSFRGMYPLMEADGQPVTPDSEYLIVDADILEIIWRKYAGGDLPPNLEQYRNEPSIIAGFTDREFVILSFEAFSMVTENYLRMTSGDEMRFEFFRQPDGTYLVGTIKEGSNNRYLTGSPLDLPSPSDTDHSTQILNFPIQKDIKIDYK